MWTRQIVWSSLQDLRPLCPALYIRAPPVRVTDIFVYSASVTQRLRAPLRLRLTVQLEASTLTLRQLSSALIFSINMPTQKVEERARRIKAILDQVRDRHDNQVTYLTFEWRKTWKENWGQWKRTAPGLTLTTVDEVRKYVDALPRPIDDVDKSSLTNTSGVEAVRWHDPSIEGFSWFSHPFFHNVTCDAELVAAIDNGLAASAPRDTPVRDPAQDAQEHTSYHFDPRTGIATITTTPLTYAMWTERRGIGPSTRLTKVTNLFKSTLSTLQLSIPPEVPSIVHVRWDDGSQVFDWFFKGEHITQVVPEDTYTQCVHPSLRSRLSLTDIGNIDVSDIDGRVRRAKNEWDKVTSPDS